MVKRRSKGRPQAYSPQGAQIRAKPGPVVRHARLPETAGPWEIIIGTLRASASDRVSLAAAGCAFWATTALFPAISTLVSLYGLVSDPAAVQAHLGLLSDLLPPPAYALIDERVRELVLQPAGKLSLNLVIGLLLTLWSAATGTKSVLSALNLAYETTESRQLLRFQLTGLAMTLLGIGCAGLAIAVLVLLPAAIAFLGLSSYGTVLIHGASLLLLVGFFAASIALLYRYGPSRQRSRVPCILPGTAIATLLWLLASGVLSFYVSHIARFGATYGSLGAVVGVMLWLFISAYAVLLGAELNARLETAHPHAGTTTVQMPQGGL